MRKPKYRFHFNCSYNTISSMDGDGTVYKPFIKFIKLYKKTGENFKNKDGSFNLDGLVGKKLVKY